MRSRLLFTVLLALSSFGLAAPAQAQSRAVAKWHSSHPLWMLRPDIVCSSTATTCSGGAGGVSVSGTNVWTGSNTFTDSLFFLQDDGDNTKKVQVQLSGITTGNTIVPFSFEGTTAAPTVGFPNGAVALPGLHPANSTNTGLWARAATALDISSSGGFVVEFGNLATTFTSGLNLGWSSGSSATSTQDVLVNREAAATLQMGADVNGAAVAQTLKAHDGVTGTDIAGANFTLAGGRGTGAGAGGNVALSAAPALGTGTTAQVLSVRQLVVGKQKSLSTTSATTTTFVRIGLTAAHESASGTIEFGIKVTDGTNDQALSGIIRWSLVNTAAGAGGETCGAAVVGTVDQTAANGGAASAGTASAVAATTTGTDLCDIQITPTFSLTATVVEIAYTVRSQSKTATITPQ